eukprot:524587-Rhodomonas_salina.1
MLRVVFRVAPASCSSRASCACSASCSAPQRCRCSPPGTAPRSFSTTTPQPRTELSEQYKKKPVRAAQRSTKAQYREEAGVSVLLQHPS